MDELDDLIGKWTINHAPEKVMEILQNAHVAAGVVQNSKDLMEKDPQMKEYHFFKEMDHPEIGRIAYENVPFTLSDTPGEARWPAPLLGQDNAYVFGEILGRSEEEINKLLKDGIIKPNLEAGMIFGGVEIKSENLDDALTMKE